VRQERRSQDFGRGGTRATHIFMHLTLCMSNVLLVDAKNLGRSDDDWRNFPARNQIIPLE
jgi:hypothetical protein